MNNDPLQGALFRATYTPSFNETSYITIQHAERWRRILWLRVGRDASIYVGLPFKKITSLRKGSTQLKGGQETARVSYSDGQLVSDPAVLRKGSKMSFHASGEIHAAGSIVQPGSLRGLDRREWLCGFAFADPKQYPAINESEIEDGPQKTGSVKRDVCIGVPFDKPGLLQAMIFAGPDHDQQPGILLSEQSHIHLTFLTSMPPGVSDSVVQVVLGYRPAESWPTETLSYFSVEDGQIPQAG